MKAKASAKILIRSTFVVLVSALAVFAYTNADEPDATYATFNTGGIELKVDSQAFYNGAAVPGLSWTLKNLVPWHDHFFLFKDVKPGDYGRTVISLHIKKSSAWACLDFTNFKDKENGKNEPEAAQDTTSAGELGQEMEFFAWFDDNGNTTFDVGEVPLFGTSTQAAVQTIKNTSYALADSTFGSAWVSGSTHYVGIAWCAGDLSVNLATAEIGCDASAMGNEAQTDSLATDIALRALTAKDNKKFRCGGKGHDGHGDNGGGICRPGDKRW